MNLLSICIPTYEMGGYGQRFLKKSFDILAEQTFTDFDVVISDHSKNSVIKDLCSEYGTKLNIHYFHNTENVGSSSANINNAIKHASGKLVKILFQDDFLYHIYSLEEIVRNFDMKKDHWLITACIHSTDGINFTKPFFPEYNSHIHLGNNTISSPSVLTIKNSTPLFFDEQLLWLMDCEYYKRCFDAFGTPAILNKINVVNRMGTHQVSHTLAKQALRNKEYMYVLQKYEQGVTFWYYRAIGVLKSLIKK